MTGSAPGHDLGMTHPWGSPADVDGVAVGHASRAGAGWLSGVTVVLPPPGTIGAVDVRGGGPATRETDALAPSTLVPTVDAVCLTGGSAYGLASADGVMRWCEEQGRGFDVTASADRSGRLGRTVVVPIVPAAAIFDLGRGGDPACRPGPDLGHDAAAEAGRRQAGDLAGPAPSGAVGAGTGALTAAGALAGGVGQAAVRVPVAAGTVTVGALVVLNAAGLAVDPADGGLLGRAFVPAGSPRPGTPPAAEAAALRAHLAAHVPSGGTAASPVPRANTTHAVVVTDAALDPAATNRTAACGHDGLARGIRPAHTLLDGDTVFALASGRVPVVGRELVAVQAAAADAVLLAVLDAVLSAPRRSTEAIDVPGYLELCPGGGC